MAVSLKDLRQVRATLPPRNLIYGPPGMGKTSLAASFPDPVFIQIEDGTPSDLEIASFGQLESYQSVLEAIAALYQEQHSYKTLVIDSLDKLQPLLWQHLCNINKWDSIETPGYGKGYTEGDGLWNDLIAGCNALRRDAGMGIVLIAHSDVERFDDPAAASYSRHQPRLHKRARAIVEDEVDTILFLNREATIKTEDAGFNKKRAHAEGGQSIWIYTEGRPAFMAKNRYGMKPKILYEKGKGYDALAQYFPAGGQPAEQAPAPVEEAAEPETKTSKKAA